MNQKSYHIIRKYKRKYNFSKKTNVYFNFMQNYARTFDNMKVFNVFVFWYFCVFWNVFKKIQKHSTKRHVLSNENYTKFQKIKKKQILEWYCRKTIDNTECFGMFFAEWFVVFLCILNIFQKNAKTVDKMICFELKNVPFSEKINKKLVLKLHCGKNITKTEWFGMFFWHCFFKKSKKTGTARKCYVFQCKIIHNLQNTDKSLKNPQKNKKDAHKTYQTIRKFQKKYSFSKKWNLFQIWCKTMPKRWRIWQK